MNSREAADFFSQEARKQIDILNAGRRQGTISADMDRQMMGQINHLLSLSNEARNSPSGPASPPKNSAAFDAASREVADFTRNAVKNARPGMSPPPPRGKAKRGAVSPTRESRTEGAPSGDLGVEPEAKPARKSRPSRSAPPENNTAYGNAAREMAEFTRDAVKNARPGVTPEPLSKDERDLEAFRRDADTESEAYRDGYTVPQPGSDSWDAQGRNLDRSRGMSERDVQHSDRERKYRQGAYDQMGRGQMNPQQPLELGSAEDQDKWDQWVRSDRQRQARYNPAAEADRQAAEDEKRYERIGTQYGTGEALAQRDADMRGVVRIPQSKAAASRNEERRRYESDAMNQGAPDADMALAYRNRASLPPEKREAIESEYATKFPARAQISEQDARQAKSNKAFREKTEAAAARSQAKRDADPRYRAWRDQMMLAGGQATGGPSGTKAVANALQGLPDEQRQSSLRYMLPGGRLSAEVDARQLDAAAKLAGSAITGALVNGPQSGAAQAQARGLAAQAQTQVDAARRPNEDVVAQRYAESGYFGYDDFTPQEQQLAYNDFIALGYTPAEAQAAVRRIAVERRATQHADLSQPPGK